MKYFFRIHALSFYAICISVSLGLATYGIFRPHINWDIIGYVSAAYSNQGFSKEDLHAKTFEDVRLAATTEQYKNLTEDGEYRITVAKNAQSLSEHLPFYTIRVLYVAIIRSLGKIFDVPYSVLTYILSAFFGGLCVLSLSLFYKNKYLVYALSLPLIVLFTGLKEASALSTPDTLATLAALLAVYLYARNSLWLGFLTLIIPLIRTDYIILSGLIGLCYFSKKEFRRGLLATVPALISYALVNHLNQNYGFFKIFTFTLIEISPFPASLKLPDTTLPFAEAYLRGFKAMIGHRHFILYVVFFIYWYRNIRPQRLRLANELVFITLGFVTLHMTLFPAYYERFFIWTSCIASITLLSWVVEKHLKQTSF